MSEKLKIAFYTDTFLPAIDGVVISMLNFKRELERRGHEVYIFTAGTKAAKKAAKQYSNVYVRSGVRFNKYPQYTIALLPYPAPAHMPFTKFDIVHAQTPFMMGISGVMHAKLYKIPLIGTFHTMFTDASVIREYTSDRGQLRKLIRRYSWSYARFFYNKCNRVIAPSHTVEEILYKHHINSVRVVPNSVDIKRFSPKVDGSAVRERLIDRRGQKLVMYVGRLSREKNIEVMLNAARLMRTQDIKFVIVGSGPAEEHYRRMASKLGISHSVKFVGFISNGALPQYYAAADVFCMPSTFETQGIVALEAMASGVPVVAADKMALRDLVKNGQNGERFRPGDARACARKIEKVINNMSAYKGMVNTAKLCSVERTTDELLDIYKTADHNI